MDDLIEFLTACLDDEQHAAEDALKRTATTRRMIQGQWVEDTIQPPEWRRSAWSPARVLREVDAKRRIIDEHPPALGWDGSNPDGPVCQTCAQDTSDGDRVGDPYPCATLRLLALPYADHPDYRDEWRP